MRDDSGFHHLPGFLSADEQQALLGIAREVVRAAPLLRPRMVIAGQVLPFKLTLTNAGPWGWWADEAGFRYVDAHPVTGRPWPPIPQLLLRLAERALDACGLPIMGVENCLLNHYAAGESLGQHQDNTEQDLDAPIVSLSIGADALFLLGGPQRSDPPREYVLRSGDLVIQSGPARRAFHGIKKLYPTMGNTLKDGGRLNFTLRKVWR